MPLIRGGPRQDGERLKPTEAGLDGLTSSSSEVRWAAARTAANQPGGIAALGRALPLEVDPRVREAMFTSLARTNSIEAADVVVPLLRSDDASLRAGALDSLRSMPEIVSSYLPMLLQDADSDVRLLVCELACVLPSREGSRLLCELLKGEPNVNVCGAAVDVLAEIGDADALAALTQCSTRFADQPFLVFSINIAAERIAASRTAPNG